MTWTFAEMDAPAQMGCFDDGVRWIIWAIQGVSDSALELSEGVNGGFFSHLNVLMVAFRFGFRAWLSVDSGDRQTGFALAQRRRLPRADLPEFPVSSVPRALARDL